MQEFL